MNKLALGVLLGCLVGTVALWNSAADVEAKQSQASFDRVADGVLGDVSGRVARYQSVVQAGKAYLGGETSPVTMAEWQAFVQGLSLTADYPGLDGLVYIRAVPASGLQAYQQQLSQELGRQVTVNTAGSRNGYCVITYVSPAEHAADWTGVDLCSIPAAQAALVSAMRDGRTVLTGPVSASSQKGALVGFYAPVYDGAAADGTSNIRGWVGAPVRFDEMMNGLLSGTPGLDVQIFDSAQEDSSHLLFDSGGSWKGAGASYDGRITSTSTLQLGGRTWMLVFSEPEVPSKVPLALALAGLLCSLLIYFIALRAGKTRIQAERMAKVMTEELRTTKARLESITYNVSEGIYRAAPNGVIEFCNPALAHLLGYDTVEQLLAAKVPLSYDDMEIRTAHGKLLVADRRFKDQEAVLRTRSGSKFYALLSQAAVYDARGSIVALDGAVLDISERKKQEKVVHDLAFFDTLTKLPNRFLFNDRLKLAVQNAARRKQKMAVMFIDMDRFKQVNDTLGHHVGDELLKEVARRLSSEVRTTDTVARLGGDEFTVILPEISSAGDAQLVAQKLVAAAGQPYKLLGNDVFSSPSVGIAIYPDDAQDAEKLLGCSDVAMYKAKDLGRNNFQFYKAEMNASAKEKLETETALHQALDRDELRVLYAPRASLITGEIVGAEVMVGWERPGHGLIESSQFMPVAVQTGQIVPIGEWLAANAFNDVRGWIREGHAVPRLSMTLTEPQVLRSQVTKMLADILLASQVPAKRLCFEISESTIRRDKPRVLAQLQELQRLGAELALTDFGVSAECLQLLAEFSFSEIVISSAYTRDIQTNKANALLLHALYAIGKDLKVRVVTKEVHTRLQGMALKTHGCDVVQGDIYAKPMSGAELLARLTKDATVAKTGTRSQ
jgi:diguanylate cyclase (GGDEF)-like protein/PAS domain S-box-containing protein